MKNIYNKLSDQYNTLYLENITQFQKKLLEQNQNDKYFVDFYPSFGIKENESTDFLIYGQAVNGWGSGFNLFDTVNSENVKDSIRSSNSFLLEKDHNPLDWVNAQWSDSVYNGDCQDDVSRNFYSGKYRAYRSFFWNVSYKLICDFYAMERSSWDWSKKMVWSNLYKIAPEDANPNWNERNLQQPFSSELIRMEIDELNPKYCIVLTNESWWTPFQKALDSKILQQIDLPTEIVCYEQYKQTQIIVTKRPARGNSDKFVQQILELIKK